MGYINQSVGAKLTELGFTVNGDKCELTCDGNTIPAEVWYSGRKYWVSVASKWHGNRVPEAPKFRFSVGESKVPSWKVDKLFRVGLDYVDRCAAYCREVEEHNARIAGHRAEVAKVLEPLAKEIGEIIAPNDYAETCEYAISHYDETNGVRVMDGGIEKGFRVQINLSDIPSERLGAITGFLRTMLGKAVA